MRLSPAAKKRHKGQALTSEELVDRSQACPLCLDARPRRPVLQIQAFPEVCFLACDACRGVSASHMPTAETIERIYRSFYLEGDREKYTFHGIRRLAAQILKHATVSPTGAHCRILEVGGGDGTLACEVARRMQAGNHAMKVSVVEVELYPGEDRRADGFSIEFTRDLVDASGPFDLVIASAVLHQVPDAHAMLLGLFDRVAPGGAFFARTAFIVPLARLFGRAVDTLYPYHVHDLGCEFWNRVPSTYRLPARVTRSRPSLVELQLRRAPLRAAAAHALKAPANLELALSRQAVGDPRWRGVGGWEVFLQFDG